MIPMYFYSPFTVNDHDIFRLFHLIFPNFPFIYLPHTISHIYCFFSFSFLFHLPQCNSPDRVRFRIYYILVLCFYSSLSARQWRYSTLVLFVWRVYTLLS